MSKKPDQYSDEQEGGNDGRQIMLNPVPSSDPNEPLVGIPSFSSNQIP